MPTVTSKSAHDNTSRHDRLSGVQGSSAKEREISSGEFNLVNPFSTFRSEKKSHRDKIIASSWCPLIGGETTVSPFYIGGAPAAFGQIWRKVVFNTQVKQLVQLFGEIIDTETQYKLSWRTRRYRTSLM